MLIAPQNSPVVAALAANLLALQQEIAAAARRRSRSEDSVTLVAVSKGHPADAGASRRRPGAVQFRRELPAGGAAEDPTRCATCALTWHFIGRIQANKTRAIAEQFDWVHGIDRLQIAERLSAQRPQHAPAAAGLPAGQHRARRRARPAWTPTRRGRAGAGGRALPRLRLRGLMCILPAGRGSEADRRGFARPCAAAAADQCARARARHAVDGHERRFREAIQEGATLIRIGTALFGPRAERGPRG